MTEEELSDWVDLLCEGTHHFDVDGGSIEITLVREPGPFGNNFPSLPWVNTAHAHGTDTLLFELRIKATVRWVPSGGIPRFLAENQRLKGSAEALGFWGTLYLSSYGVDANATEELFIEISTTDIEHTPLQLRLVRLKVIDKVRGWETFNTSQPYQRQDAR